MSMKRTRIQTSLATRQRTCEAGPLTDKVTKSGSQLNFGLDERVAVVLKGNEKDLFHLVG